MLKLENEMDCEEFLKTVITSLRTNNYQNVDERYFEEFYQDGEWSLNDGDYFGEIIPWKENVIDNGEYFVRKIDGYGGEGQGDSYWYVFEILNKKTDETKFVKFDGHYDSWNGVNWGCYDGPCFVKPTKKVIIDWVSYE